jgi:hypothetical protein
MAVFFVLAWLSPAAAQTNPYEAQEPWASRGRIDELVSARWAELGIRPAQLCSDAVFLRRAFLDTIGTLPTAREAAEFLENPAPAKRVALIDRLLEREEFADYWAMKWADVLRIKSEFPINLWPNAVQAYHRWIRTAIRDNVPYDRFARELLTSSGSNFRVPTVNFYRALQSREPEAIAKAVALTFMATRAEKWPGPRLSGMAAFFSRIGYKATREWKEEIVFFDGTRLLPPANGAVFPDGRPARIAENQDPREVFADWLVAAENPWFARAAVNRIWAWLLGRGIVHEPDDLREDNPPANPALLSYLERELVGSKYNLKHIYRLILNSGTYQLSAIPGSNRAEAAVHFASYPLRRLDAEVLIDAICAITGTAEEYSSAIPEPYTYMPEGQRSIALPDASIGSAFLDLFGRPPRDSGLESERNNHATASQRLHLLNSSHVQNKIQQSAKLRTAIGENPPNTVSTLYLSILSRYPSAEETRLAAAYVQSFQGNRWGAVVDIAWALINSAEFLYRH